MEKSSARLTPRSAREKGVPYWKQLVAGGLFTGFSPVASGTVASAVACAFYFIPGVSNPLILLAMAGVAFLVGLPLVEDIEERLGEDPAFFTLDEFAGQWLVLASPIFPSLLLGAPIIPFDPIWAVIAFLTFRTFDIAKTWPASWFDSRGGALGVMGDDIVAGVYAAICSHAIWFGLSLAGIVSEFLST